MDKVKHIEAQIEKIHTDIKKSSLVLRERMHDIQLELTEWNLLDGHNVERIKGEEDYLQ